MAVNLTDLKRLHALNKEIEYEKAKLYSLSKKHDHVSIIGVGLLKRDEHLYEVKELERTIAIHLKECLELYKQILDFINTIPDPLLRLIVSLRFVNGLEWEQIALHIGGGNTAESVRKACTRFISKHFK